VISPLLQLKMFTIKVLVNLMSVCKEASLSNYTNRFSQGRYWPDCSQEGASVMEKLLDEAMQRSGTCLHRPAPQSERGLKENEIAQPEQIR